MSSTSRPLQDAELSPFLPYDFKWWRDSISRRHCRINCHARTAQSRTLGEKEWPAKRYRANQASGLIDSFKPRRLFVDSIILILATPYSVLYQ